tara:strand:- start:9772 stop:10206 length:435 start_codon:yes stop_codon:yes gene_type:complete
MYDDPEHEDYDDDEYKYFPDGGQFYEYNEHGYPKEFKIDWEAWEAWLSQTIKEIQQEDNKWIVSQYHSYKAKEDFPVSDELPKGTLSDQHFAYLGNNHYDEAIWKVKYFINNELDISYKNHLASHAGYFLKQPKYYRGLFDNLN